MGEFQKIVLTIVFLPIILIALVAGGLLYIAFPILIVLGLISFSNKKIGKYKVYQT